MIDEHSTTLTSADGTHLHAVLAKPANPVAVMVLCHGMTVDCDEHGAFPALRDLVLKAGIAVARYDARAHGRSGGTNEDMRMTSVRDDADAVMAWVDDELGSELPLIPLGVSFGGAAAIHIASTRTRCAGLALWYAVVDYEWNYSATSPVPFTQMMRSARAETDPEWSAMPVVGTDYFMPTALVEEFARDRTAELLCALTVPVLSWHGSRDNFVYMTPLRRIAADRPNFDVRVAYGASHGFFLWRQVVIRHTAAWAIRRAREASAVPAG